MAVQPNPKILDSGTEQEIASMTSSAEVLPDTAVKVMAMEPQMQRRFEGLRKRLPKRRWHPY